VAEPAVPEACELTFDDSLPLGDSAEVALEDYARVLTAAAGAEAVRSNAAGARVIGVRLVQPAVSPSREARRDIEDFARGLAAENGGAGLGWA
jgi:hypothetical protein